MADLPPPTLRLTVDTDALANNWSALDRMSGNANAGAAIKADCYGLGTEICLPVLRDAGCRDFFVAHWSEVPDALCHIPANRLSVFHGPTTADDARFAIATGIKPVINSLDQARRWLDADGGNCDVMIDSGINRLGLSMSDIGDPILGDLNIDLLMSHLACADEDLPMNARQLSRFGEAIATIPARRHSLANSAGIALGPDYHFDLTRPGLSLYGGIQGEELQDRIHQVAYLQAAILQTRTIDAGDSVGYNAMFTADRRMQIGVACLGYADGFLRSWKGASLAHKGAKLPILGKISMDMVVLDMAAAVDLGEGDWVDVPYDLQAASRHTGLSQYELLTVLGSRLRN